MGCRCRENIGHLHLCDAHLLALVPEELACVFNDLLVRELGVGLLLTQSQDLPQSHPECPHVTGHGELTLREQTTSIHIQSSIDFIWTLACTLVVIIIACNIISSQIMWSLFQGPY